MKALIIGGTGTISSAVVRRLIEKQWEVYVINRGTKQMPDGVISIIADMLAAGEISHLVSGEIDQSQPGRNNQCTSFSFL